jgi:hypothetical protein
MNELTIQQLEKELARHSHDLSRLADLLEGSEGASRREISRDYRRTFEAYKRTKLRLDNLNKQS